MYANESRSCFRSGHHEPTDQRNRSADAEQESNPRDVAEEGKRQARQYQRDVHGGELHHAFEREERAPVLTQLLGSGRIELCDSHLVAPVPIGYRAAATVSTSRPAANVPIHRAPELL